MWNVTWGGTNDDAGYATATGDSEYLAGFNYSFGAGGSDAFLVKYSEPAAAPALTPPGLIALAGLLSIVAALSIRKRKE